jgi:hypothetical protein
MELRSLSPLVPKYLTHVPPDPFAFDTKMRAVMSDDGGIVVYSVGRNEKDDGGVKETRDSGEYQGDVTFTLSPQVVARRTQ